MSSKTMIQNAVSMWIYPGMVDRIINDPLRMFTS